MPAATLSEQVVLPPSERALNDEEMRFGAQTEQIQTECVETALLSRLTTFTQHEIKVTGGPLCGPPANGSVQGRRLDELNFPRSFDNQGDCVSNVNTGK